MKSCLIVSCVAVLVALLVQAGACELIVTNDRKSGLTSGIERNKRPAPEPSSCRRFIGPESGLTMYGEIMRKIGNGANPEICKRECADATDFHCAAALVQLPATCYLTGYRLRGNYFSIHYRRNCSSGAGCFSPEYGRSAGLGKAEDVIPSQRASLPRQAAYCRGRCESLGSTCVGFDLRIIDQVPRCVLLDLGFYSNPSFALFVRRC